MKLQTTNEKINNFIKNNIRLVKQSKKQVKELLAKGKTKQDILEKLEYCNNIHSIILMNNIRRNHIQLDFMLHTLTDNRKAHLLYNYMNKYHRFDIIGL